MPLNEDLSLIDLRREIIKIPSQKRDVCASLIAALRNKGQGVASLRIGTAKESHCFRIPSEVSLVKMTAQKLFLPKLEKRQPYLLLEGGEKKAFGIKVESSLFGLLKSPDLKAERSYFPVLTTKGVEFLDSVEAPPSPQIIFAFDFFQIQGLFRHIFLNASGPAKDFEGLNAKASSATDAATADLSRHIFLVAPLSLKHCSESSDGAVFLGSSGGICES